MKCIVCPVPDHLALDISDERTLCIGDMHVGIESELCSKGIHVPSQTYRMEKELASLAPGHDRLVLLGDVKNKVPGSSIQEHAEIPRLFRSLLQMYSQIDIVKGNHDTDLEDFLPPGVIVHPSTGFSIGTLALHMGTHGPLQILWVSVSLFLGTTIRPSH